MLTLSAGLSEADLCTLCMVEHPSAASALEFSPSSNILQVHLLSSRKVWTFLELLVAGLCGGESTGLRAEHVVPCWASSAALPT